MRFKKIIAVLCLVLVVTAGAFSLSACDDLPDNSEGVSVKLIVLSLESEKLYEKELITKKSSLYEAFNEFEGLGVQTTSSFTGAMVNAVSVVGQDGFTVTAKIQEDFPQGLFIAVYHDIGDAALRNPFETYDIRYDGKDYYSSPVGVSQLPLMDGAAYILKLASF